MLYLFIMKYQLTVVALLATEMDGVSEGGWIDGWG
jgi:hypothetical protein